MTDVELIKILSKIKSEINMDDRDKHEALKTVITEIEDRVCNIAVGDEIMRVSTNELQVITHIHATSGRDISFLGIKPNGDTMPFYYCKSSLIAGEIIKTGKHYPQIEEVLKGLRGEKE